MVSPTRASGDVLDLRGDEADFARPIGQLLDLGPHTADAVDQMLCAADHELDLLTFLEHPVHHAHRMTTPR
jgi:hypothetical protein